MIGHVRKIMLPFLGDEAYVKDRVKRGEKIELRFVPRALDGFGRCQDDLASGSQLGEEAFRVATRSGAQPRIDDYQGQVAKLLSTHVEQLSGRARTCLA